MTDTEAPITRAGLASPGGLDLSVPGPNGRALLASQEADGSSARTYPRRLPVAIAEASASYILFWGNRTTGNTAAVPDGVNPSLQPSGTYPRAILDSHRPRRLADWGPPATVGRELLYDRRDDWFLALSGYTPVIRYVQLPDQPRAIQIDLPLRILVIKSEPADCPPLDLAAEWEQVAEALLQLRDAGLVAFTELTSPTLGELRRALVNDTFHVLHYMGHGAFDQQNGGTLLFADRAGRSVPVTGGDLGVMLRNHTSMRLAVLNACEAGRTDPADPFAGVADTLVRRGIPAVVAMQFEVTDNAAVEFAPALYGALAVGRPVDMAVAEARKAMYTVSPIEWATPVLYLRADDARLFDITGHSDSNRAG